MIVVVDDDANIRDTVLDILRMEGYAAEGYSCAKGVVERVARGDVSLVITDLNMPDIDGLQLLSAIKELEAGGGPHAEVIVLTGAGGENRAEEAVALGAHSRFCKPFNLDEFLDAVCDAIGPRQGGGG